MQVTEQMPSVLIAIASYGTAQDHYLEKVLAEFHKLRLPCRIVVLSNQHKSVQGAEVVVGLPSSNPYSLPFAHRKLFDDNADKFDLFIYTEDDTLLTEKHIELFLSTQASLKDGEIAGFIRSETSPDSQKYITSINTFFRWLPDTVVRRNGELFAQLSNEHSGCFIATRQQLKRAIESGGFLVKPYMCTYGMLETAASDIYTRCGLRRLICISRIQDFIVPHLANKYYSRMGIPVEELEFQVQALSDLYQNGQWNGSLFNPQTKMPGFRWSKSLYDRPDEELLQIIPPSTKNLLSVGSGWGENEMWLSKQGINVCAIPIDAVFARKLRRHGIRTIEGSFDKVVERLIGEQFDTILMADMLNLVESPVGWLRKLRNLLLPDGYLIASVSNTTEVLSWVRDWYDGRKRPLFPEYEVSGAHFVSVRQLHKWCQSSGLEPMHIRPVITSSSHLVRKIGIGPLKSVLSTRFILKARQIL